MVVATLTTLLAPWPLAILVDTLLGDKPLPSLLGPLDSLGRTQLLVLAASAGLFLAASKTAWPS